MSHVVRYQDDDGEQLEDLTSLEDALARLQELHEVGNPTGRVYREVPVRVQTVVHVSVDETPSAPVVTQDSRVATEPVSTEPVATEAELVAAEPVVEPVAAEPVRVEPEPVAAEPVDSVEEVDETTVEQVAAEATLAPVELPPLPAFFDEPDDAPPPPPAPAPAPRRAVTAVDFVARSS